MLFSLRSWRIEVKLTFHQVRNLTSQFSALLVQQARQKARHANARLQGPKSSKPFEPPGLTGEQNSRRIDIYGTDIKEEDLEAVFTQIPRKCGTFGDGTPQRVSK